MGGGNILINGDFKNLMNQRGQSVYDAGGYNIDAWMNDAVGVVTPTSAGLRLETPNQSGYVTERQYVDEVSSLKGKPVTFSVSAGGRIYAIAGLVPSGDFPDGQTVIASDGDADGRILRIFAYRYGTEEILFVIFGHYASRGAVVYEYAKLEEGRIATPLVREDPAIALMRCERRYRTLWLQQRSVVLTHALDGIVLEAPGGMRANPAVSLKSGSTMNFVDALTGATFYGVDVSAATFASESATDKITIHMTGFTLPSGLTKNSYRPMRIGGSNTVLALSADL